MAPHTVAEKDKVACFVGMHYPMIIRQHEETSWKIIAPAYVHEWSDNMDEGLFKRDGKTLEEFILNL